MEINKHPVNELFLVSELATIFHIDPVYNRTDRSVSYE